MIAAVLDEWTSLSLSNPTKLRIPDENNNTYLVVSLATQIDEMPLLETL
jgi:hypothetical protein